MLLLGQLHPPLRRLVEGLPRGPLPLLQGLLGDVEGRVVEELRIGVHGLLHHLLVSSQLSAAYIVAHFHPPSWAILHAANREYSRRGNPATTNRGCASLLRTPSNLDDFPPFEEQSSNHHSKTAYQGGKTG